MESGCRPVRWMVLLVEVAHIRAVPSRMLDRRYEGGADEPMACIASVPVLVCSQRRLRAVEFAENTVVRTVSVVRDWAIVDDDDDVVRALMIDDCVNDGSAIDEQIHRVMSFDSDESRVSAKDNRCRTTSTLQFCSSLDREKARRWSER